MASLDVSSLFTNVPLQETIDICVSKLFQDNDTVHGLNKDQFRKLMSFAVQQNHFLFEGKVYDQKDGVAMGSPLGPILANIFMSHLEDKCFDSLTCAKPLVYHRYVDDTFAVFTSKEHMLHFYEHVNSLHPSIKFTKDEEQCNSLPFLDVLVTRQDDGCLVTSVYRKPTFSGLYLKWDSFVPKQYKSGLIYGLISRQYVQVTKLPTKNFHLSETCL